MPATLTEVIPEVTYQPGLSRFQYGHDDCINCSTLATQEAVCGTISRIRCCDSVRCMNVAETLARAPYQAGLR